MSDIRYKKLAKVISEWSIKVQTGEKVLISCSSPSGLPLAEEVYKQVLQKGGLPRLDIKDDNLDHFYFTKANLKQLKAKPEVAYFLAKWADKIVNIVAEKNSYELASVDPKKLLLRSKVVKPVKDIMLKKPWVLTYLPTSSLAQDARISLQEAKDIYFQSCLLDWPKLSVQATKLKKRLDKVNEIHVKGYKTDLKLYFQGRTFAPCVGTHNLPDGEIFSAPLETKTEGFIFFNFPSLRQGKKVRDVFLQFKNGQVVDFDASAHKQYLKENLAIDKGAKCLGEFAFGLNYGLTKFMYNTLFDEKIGGTIHLALGNAYPEDEDGGGNNESAIHWDLVKDMRLSNSTVHADGKLIFKNGKLVI